MILSCQELLTHFDASHYHKHRMILRPDLRHYPRRRELVNRCIRDIETDDGTVEENEESKGNLPEGRTKKTLQKGFLKGYEAL